MPRIVSENELKFNLFREGETLKKNKYGIDELMNEDYINPKVLNTMFIPFVGIDKNGYRLGYGGGFFDKTLEQLKSQKYRPLFVGLGYDYQILEEHFGESHDIKYDLVITESRVLSYH
jgi:5,10-methenyltetrahydrofolate synthetase